MPNFSGGRKTFGGSTGGTTGLGDKGSARDKASKVAADVLSSLAKDYPDNPVLGNNFKGKKTEGGAKPGEDNIAKAQTLVNTQPLTDVEKAVLEARRQRNQLAPGLDAAQTLMGLTPAPGLGMAFGVGRWMGKQTEDDAAVNPGNYSTNPKDPGSLFSKSGPLQTNRAVDLPSNKANTTSASADENVKKKKQALPTLLGASANPLGTFSNPVMIT